MTKEKNSTVNKQTSTGHNLSRADHLDLHFESMRPEYEAMLNSANIQPGWRVLDSGSGSGGFLPLIDQKVGKNGRIDALDIAPENVELVQKMIKSETFVSQIEPKLGSVFELPYPDNEFDLVWSANVAQYLNDDEFAQMISESFRVTKPGGFFALKEYDALGSRQWEPLDPLWSHRLLASTKEFTQVHGTLRTTANHRWVKAAGFELISVKTFITEFWNPLPPIPLALFKSTAPFIGQLAMLGDMSEEDQKIAQRLIDLDGPESILNEPDFYWRESNMLVIGQKPE